MKKFEVGKKYPDHRGIKYTFNGLTPSDLGMFTSEHTTVVCNIFTGNDEYEIAVAKTIPGVYHNYEEFHADGNIPL